MRPLLSSRRGALSSSSTVISGTVVNFQTVSDFPYIYNPQGVSNISGGVRFVANTSMPAPWESNSKICQGKGEGTDAEFGPRAGDHYLWEFGIRFPSSGNLNGFRSGWGHACLMEFGTANTGGIVAVGHELMLNNDGRLKFLLGPWSGGQPTVAFVAPTPIQFDQIHNVVWEQHWSYGNDGYMRGVIDGVTLMDRYGPTMWVNEWVRHLGIGWYQTLIDTNTVEYLGMRATKN